MVIVTVADVPAPRPVTVTGYVDPDGVPKVTVPAVVDLPQTYAAS